jgi:hypothetical protein
MHVEISRTFPAPRKAGFEYVTNLATWHEWSAITIPEGGEAGFTSAGDVAAYTYKPLGVPLHGTMFLQGIRAPEVLKVMFQQRAFADVHLGMDFENAGAHAFTLTVTLDVDEPTWWDRSLHWLTLAPAIMRRDIRRSLEGLHTRFTTPADLMAEAS